MQVRSTPTSPAVRHVQPATSLHERLEHKLAALRRYRGTVDFFHNHRSLLASGGESGPATARLAFAKRRVTVLAKQVRALRHRIAERDAKRLAKLPPRTAICSVFGSYCREALAVAWCESRLRPMAQNGQYLGLFQMGWYARRQFGHGSTPRAQAIAAHRYFVRSGRDWSPWSCGWAAA